MPRGVLREMLAEFLGTFILIVFGVGVVAQVVLSKGTAGTLPVDQHRVGAGGDDGVLRVGGRDRRAPEPGGDAGARRAPEVSVEQGAAVLARAARRRVRRVGGRLRHLSRGADRVRRRRPSGRSARRGPRASGRPTRSRS